MPPAMYKGTVLRRFAEVVLILTLVLFCACSQARPATGQPLVEMRQLLGTACSVTIYGQAPAGAIEKVFERVRQIEEKMSVNLDSSELSAINAAAGRTPVRVSAESFDLVERALVYGAKSGGAFDISVGPLVKLWGIGTDAARLPRPAEIKALLPLVDHRLVRTDRAASSVYLERPGMRLDLGAIAKGWAADESARVLRELGVKGAILDFGGNVMLLGRKPNGQAWRIGVQNPMDARGNYIGVLTCDEKAVVTSGVYERFFEQDGRRWHHILDTATGYPVENGLISVSIVADNSTDADALSTTIFALGLEKGRAFAAGLPAIGVVFVTAERKVHITSNLRKLFELTDPEFTLEN
jgi:FAD:protein FMN transferase